MSLSFKQFKTVLELPDDQLTEEKLAEIFGWSPEEKKAKAAKALADIQAKKKNAAAMVARARADKAAVAKAGGLGGYMMDPKEKGMLKRDVRQPTSASGGRAAERDWVRSMQSEGELAEGSRINGKMNKKVAVLWNTSGGDYPDEQVGVDTHEVYDFKRDLPKDIWAQYEHHCDGSHCEPLLVYSRPGVSRKEIVAHLIDLAKHFPHSADADAEPPHDITFG
jgi:hypothetical protein